MTTLLVTPAGRLRQLRQPSAWLMGGLASLGAIAMASPARAEARPSVTPTVAQVETTAQPVTEPTTQPVANAAAPAPETLSVELPEELGDLRDMGQEIGDRLSEIDPAVIQQVMRPLGRQALQIFLDSAPGLSQKAIELGEQGLAELEKRAAERLDQAQREFEQNKP